MRYFAYLHNEEIGRKLCSPICEKSYEFYEFERSVPRDGDFVCCSRRRNCSEAGRKPRTEDEKRAGGENERRGCHRERERVDVQSATTVLQWWECTDSWLTAVQSANTNDRTGWIERYRHRKIERDGWIEWYGYRKIEWDGWIDRMIWI